MFIIYVLILSSKCSTETCESVGVGMTIRDKYRNILAHSVFVLYMLTCLKYLWIVYYN